ncbi:MAG TPA: sigma-70 family RNA polymerase sigma factor [Thermoanaerobaculia bacterium]
MASPPRSAAPLRASDDLAIVRRMVAGEAEALAELYDRFAPLVLAVARRILGGAGDAEEVLQEAFLQAWNQADRYDAARSSVSTWLVLISRSRALDRLRSRGARDRTAAAAAAEPPPADTSSRLDEHVLHRERQRRVRDALAAIPEEQRRVLELAFYGGLSQSEIATRTGTPLGTVKTRALLGMKKLRQELRSEIRELM